MTNETVPKVWTKYVELRLYGTKETNVITDLNLTNSVDRENENTTRFRVPG